MSQAWLPSSPGGQSFGALREAGIVPLAILLLALVLIGAAYLFHRFTLHRQLQQRDNRRHRRRRTRPDATTLARSGGLPPKRPDEPGTLNSPR